jgi:subtilisin family serine protease
MDPVFDAQYVPVRNRAFDQDTQIEVAYSADGWVDYIYVADQLLARREDTDRLRSELPGLRHVERDERRGLGGRRLPDGLAVLSIDHLDEGRFTVPEIMDRLEANLGGAYLGLHDGEPLVTPVHVMHTAKMCAASEPQVPIGSPTQPSPPVKGNRGDQDRVRLVISDTGLLEDFLPGRLHVDRYPWLEGVDGDRHADPLSERILPRGLPGIPDEGEWRSIPFEAGHGTFAAGVARSMAPRTSVYVANHFTMAGAALEYEVTGGLDELIRDQSPHVINVPAGTYTRGNFPLLSFSEFFRRHDDITLVAAAGNDSTNRPFWPAAFPWKIGVIGVGALGGDEENLSWYSNYGDWVNVYSLGEGLVNAYATGLYVYQQPEKRPTQQFFRGMAQWDGTSFASALVSGLIAAEIARGGGGPAREAAERVLAAAREISGVRPYASPW